MCLHVALTSHRPFTVAPFPSSISVEVSINNTSNHLVTFLKWATPFDALAGPLGVFTVYDPETGEPVPMNIVKISRKLPASRNDLIEIPAGQIVKKTVHIPEVVLEPDREYLLRAEGAWLAIWENGLADVDESRLVDLGDSKSGEFRSDTTLLKSTCAGLF